MIPAIQAATAPVRTLIVDDAPLMRRVIQQILSNREDIEVVGTASNGLDCLDKIPELRPDVITLDIDMPVMNGITAVKNIMVRHQIPVVIISSLVHDGYFAFEALRLGVMDFIPKPSRITTTSWEDDENLVRTRVRAASGMQVHKMRRVRHKKLNSTRHGSLATLPPQAIIVMGTTLAGPNTIMHTVTQLPPDFPGTIIAMQEIHPRILTPFCSCFNEISPLEVVPIIESCPILPGRVYMGSTFKSLKVENTPGGPFLVVGDASMTPIDGLFSSAAQCFDQNTCGVLLTGVGKDGAVGMKEIRRRGGLTIAQEQDCCVYPNLVENAIREQAVDILMSMHGISARLKSWIEGKAE